MPRLALSLYLLLVTSWFTHAAARIPLLGVIRFDMLLVGALAMLAFLQPARSPPGDVRWTQTDKALAALFIYVLLTLPLVAWPGSVVRNGLPNFLKAVMFYYFTVAFVSTSRDLARLVAVFIACQALRVIEPLYLHLAHGYWGSVAYLQGSGEMLQRLSGAPYDVINPNGLAFVVCTILPFLYFLCHRSWRTRPVLLALGAVCLYALMLTGSRTGFLALVVVCLGILAKARSSRLRLLVAVACASAFLAFASLLSADLKDRYLSIFDRDTLNAATAAGRVDGVQSDFQIALRRPLFGHGLGTSAESNYHVTGNAQPAHNLYAEVAQELGFIGLGLFLWLMVTIVRAFAELRRLRALQPRQCSWLPALVDAMHVWLAVMLLFSLASYGLTSYEWYLLAGLTVVVRRLDRTAHRTSSHAAQDPAPFRPLIYVDFDRGIRCPTTDRALDALTIDGEPVPGAIDFLREATRRFTVVVCSPRCDGRRGARAVADWLETRGAPVSGLEFAARQPPASHGGAAVVEFAGRWPTIDELQAFAGRTRHAR